uniref:F-box domain-containing protein n=1 Tax=Pseudo-nitzschia australis TaxID=44445 RepID=A0A7S4AEZ2_9STRA
MSGNDNASFLVESEGDNPRSSNKKRSTECSCSCQSRSSSRRRVVTGEESRRLPSEIKLKILSASYGPCEYNHGDEIGETSIPSTRDCSSFVLDLLLAARKNEQGNQEQQQQQNQQQQDRDRCIHTIRLSPTVDGKVQSFIYLLSGVDHRNDYSHHFSSRSKTVSMNAIFGDPCPGKTKRLEVRYMITEVIPEDYNLRFEILPPPIPPPTEIHRASFAEHETVKLRRCLTTINTITTAEEIEERGEDVPKKYNRGTESTYCAHCTPGPVRKLSWQLQPEIVLPVIFPFLDLWEKMQCRLICRCWKKIVQECGVSRSIDVNNMDIMTSVKPNTRTSTDNNVFAPNILRGLLAYSYSSLQSLFLSGFRELEQKDLHSALPHLRNLRVLDISHCLRLDDSTLQLLARSDVPSSATLRVLYLKGLHQITDVGLKAICLSCRQLEVLDLSHLTNITDEGGGCIQRLVSLRSLFLRDNWRLTNDSLDAITTSCSKLEQLTLWGFVQLRRLKFDNCNNSSSLDPSTAHTIISIRLVILNLWGCHDLEDNTAHVLSSIHNLNSLIVSECHRLTDRFVQIFVEGKDQRHLGKGHLKHLHLRYLKRITDTAVVAIALNLRDLFSLDLTFCSKVTPKGIYRLLDELRHNLVELRLKSCRHLQIGKPNLGENDRRRFFGQQSNNVNHNHDHAGQWVLNALRRRPHSKKDHTLCLLDVRGCGGQPAMNLPYTKGDPFVKAMSALNFTQKVPGFFSRST